MVDLHIHTYFSDGTMSPEEIAKQAYDKNLKVIAVTDHNNIEAYERLKKACDNYDILAIRGVEIDCRYKDKIVHVLAYDFNDNKELFDLINKSKNELLQTSVLLIERMSKDYKNISSEDFESYEYDRTKGAWKGVHYLVDRGLSDSILDGLKYYKEYNCGYTEFDFPKIKDVCSAIHSANGYAVLAHPSNFYSELSKQELICELESFKSCGIDGVECYYPSNGKELTETCAEFCKENNMVITAGADYHGTFLKTIKDIEYSLGAVKVDISKLNLPFVKEI